MTLIEPSFRMLPVHPLPPQKIVVTAWRAGRGEEFRTAYTQRSTRRVRLAWSPSEASDLAGLPLRTLHLWAEKGIVSPTFVHDKAGIVRPRYSAIDVLRLRLAYDLREAGHTIRQAQLAADDLATIGPGEECPQLSFADMVDLSPHWLVAADEETAETLQRDWYGTLIPFGDPNDDGSDGEVFAEFERRPELRVVEYPMVARCEELAERAERWWRKVGTPKDSRPPWLT